MAQRVKNLPAMQDTCVRSLGREDPLKKGKAIHSGKNTVAWRIPWTEEPGRLQSMGSQSWTQLSDFTLGNLLGSFNPVRLLGKISFMSNLSHHPVEQKNCHPSHNAMLAQIALLNLKKKMMFQAIIVLRWLLNSYR